MTRSSVTLGAIALAFAVAPQAVQAQGTCRGEGSASRELVSRFLTRPGFGPDRSELGLAGATMSNVRILADETDASACQQLATAVDAAAAGSNWRWTGYQVGNYYFVAFRRSETANSKWLGFVPLYIFDTTFHQVRGITM